MSQSSAAAASAVTASSGAAVAPASSASASSGSSGSGTTRSGHSSFAEVNALKLQLRELQARYDNLAAQQQAAKGNTGAAAAATAGEDRSMAGVESSSVHAGSLASSGVSFRSGAGGSSAASGASAADFLALQSSTHSLQSVAASLQSSLLARAEEIEHLKSERAAAQSAVGQRDELVAALRAELAAALSTADSLRGEARDGSALLDKLSQTVSDYESRIESYEARMTHLEAEHKGFEALKTAKIEADALVEKLRSLLLQSTSDSNRQTQDLLNKLLSTRQFLEELKAEYEAFSAASRAEHALYAKTKSKQLAELSEKYDGLKLAHYEQNAAAHAEQMEIIQALQANFQEYRLMVESLFYTEAQSLSAKLAAQSSQFEREVAYILKSKDRDFQSMCTAKDAKILMLIEGTDLARLMLAQQMELEALHKRHEKTVEALRAQAALDRDKATSSLRKELLDKSAEIDKYHTQILLWESKLEQTLILLRKQKKLHGLKEESSARDLASAQTELKQAYQNLEALTQLKENLRHRILRLRLQIEGTADDSIPSIIKRLTVETKRLATDLSSMTFQARTKSEALESLARAHAMQSKQMGALESELALRADQFAKVTKTLEGLLQLRLRGGVLGGARPGAGKAGPQSLYDPAVTQALKGLSTPFLQALYQHRGEASAGMDQTVLRATAHQGATAAEMAPTMVGLRLGLGASARDDHAASYADESDSKDASSSVAAGAGAASGMQSPPSGRGSQASQVRRRSVVLELAPSASDAASSTGALSARSGSVASNHTAAGGAEADAESTMIQSGSLSHRSHRADDDPSQQQQQHLQLPNSHGVSTRHSPLSGSPSQAAAFDESLRSQSRSERLHDLIKATPSLALPAGLRRQEPPRSLREQLKREQALLRDPTLAEDGSSRSAGAPSKSSGRGARGPRYSKPAVLSSLESNAELVDLDLLRSLEQGFLALERFKGMSREFAADAKGKAKKANAVAAAAAAGDRGSGLGAFARDTSQSQLSSQMPAAAPASFGQTGPASSWSAAGGGAAHAGSGADESFVSSSDVSDRATKFYGGGGAGSQHLSSSSLRGSNVVPLPQPADDFEGGVAGVMLDGDDEAFIQSVRLAAAAEESSRSRLQHYGLDLHDPSAALESMGLASSDGEVARLYNPAAASTQPPSAASSSIPWWSSAAPLHTIASQAHAASPAAVATSSSASPPFVRSQQPLQPKPPTSARR